MAFSSPQEITALLRAWNAGDEAALKQLTPLVYQELHRLAHRHLAGERQAHSLQTSALVNEAYLRLVDARQVDWQNRAHFFGVSARLMRQILVDFARQRDSQKRGGAETLVPELKEAGHWRSWTLVNQGSCFPVKKSSTEWAIQFFSFATRRTSSLFTVSDAPLWWMPGLALSEDGRRLIYAHLEQPYDEIIMMENFH